MSAGRLQLYAKRASLRDRTSRLLLRLARRPRVRVREFGTRQAAWVSCCAPRTWTRRSRSPGLGPGGVARPAAAARAARRAAPAALAAARPAGGRRHRPHLGRRILNVARLSPFKRGDDLWDAEADALRAAMTAELGRVLDVYEDGRAPAAGEVPQADARACPPRRAVSEVRDDARGGVLRGLRDDVLPDLTRRRTGYSRTAGSLGCSSRCHDLDVVPLDLRIGPRAGGRQQQLVVEVGEQFERPRSEPLRAHLQPEPAVRVEQ